MTIHHQFEILMKNKGPLMCKGLLILAHFNSAHHVIPSIQALSTSKNLSFIWKRQSFA